MRPQVRSRSAGSSRATLGGADSRHPPSRAPPGERRGRRARAPPRSGGAGVAPRGPPGGGPIPAPRRVERLEENAGAAELELTKADLAEIEEAAEFQLTGDRYAPAMQKLINR